MAAAAPEHPRRVLRDFVSLELCKELEFIHRSCGTVGYRPSVFSTTLPYLATTNCIHLILPFLPLRDRLKDVVEATFGCEYELFVEFTGLISWCKGACIGWHSDNNQPYLKQRDFSLILGYVVKGRIFVNYGFKQVHELGVKISAVCYLNSHEKNFKGGLFHFKDGEPSSFAPIAGDVLIYTADERNIHCVDEVIGGERLALNIWFTRDRDHDEDAKIIRLLPRTLQVYLPPLAPSSMYKFAKDESEFDIRCARASILGYDLCSSETKSSTCNPSSNPSERLDGMLYVGRGDEVLVEEFASSLHALQVLQFCFWRASEILAEQREVHREGSAEPNILKRTNNLEVLAPCSYEVAVEIFGGTPNDDTTLPFTWDDLVFGITRWEEYISELRKKLSDVFHRWHSDQVLVHAST